MQLTAAPDLRTWVALARRAEALGYAVVSLPDHLGEQFAPFSALGALAATTEHIHLSTNVLANDFRHPVVLAKEAATLDVLSGGRLELGLGAGWMASEYEAAGIPFDPPAVRIERLAEAVRIVRALLRGERVDVAGRHYQVRGLLGFPRSLHAVTPPLLLGGGGRRMLTLAAREADIVSIVTTNAARTASSPLLGPDATFERAATKVAWVREAAGARFEEIELHTRVLLCALGRESDEVVSREAAASALSVHDVRSSPLVVSGTIAEAVAKLRQLRAELGLSAFTVSQREMESFAAVVEQLAGQ